MCTYCMGHVKCDTSYCALKIAFVAILTVRSHSTSVQVIDTSHCIQSLYTFDSEFVTHSLITVGHGNCQTDCLLGAKLWFVMFFCISVETHVTAR